MIDPESKCKALFVRNVIQDGNGEEEYLLGYGNSGQFTRNGKEWLQTGNVVKGTPHCESTKSMYRHFINSLNITVKAKQDHPEVDWVTLWRNLSNSFLCAEDRSNLFLLINDVISTKEKLVAYGIGRLQDSLCEYCGKTDNNLHRLTECIKTEAIRKWTQEVINNKLNIHFKRFDDILAWESIGNDPRKKSALWLVVHSIGWSINSSQTGSLYCFQKSIREIRWANKRSFEKHFERFMNIC